MNNISTKKIFVSEEQTIDKIKELKDLNIVIKEIKTVMKENKKMTLIIIE